MRRAKRVMLWASCTVPVAAAMVMTGVGTAGATTINHAPNQHSGYPGQGNGWGNGWGNGHGNGNNPPSCSKWQLEKWNLNDRNNTVDLTYNNGSYTYNVTLRQKGSCLTGSLTDAGYNPALTGPITGTVKGDNVTFSFSYPTNSIQGKRTFTGTVGHRGAVSGTWGETGGENGTGTWSLATHAHPACPPWFRSHRGLRECTVR